MHIVFLCVSPSFLVWVQHRFPFGRYFGSFSIRGNRPSAALLTHRVERRSAQKIAHGTKMKYMTYSGGAL